MKGDKKEIRRKSFANDIGRLAQGVGNRIDGTNTIFFGKKSALPRGKKVTYGRLVCDIKEHKSETHQTRLTVGGNLIYFPGLLITPIETVTTAKFLFNSVISTPGAKCLVADVKNFYLNNDLPNPVYETSPSYYPPRNYRRILPPRPSGQRRVGVPQYCKRNVRIKASRDHHQHVTYQTP